MKYLNFFFLFFFSWAWLSPTKVHADVLKITDFPGYEFYKHNFSYQENRLQTLQEPPQKPVFSLDFEEVKTVDHRNNFLNNNFSAQWDNGISGKALRFYGKGSEYPLIGWEKFFSRDRSSSFTLSFYFRPLTVMREEILLQGVKESSLAEGMFHTAFRVLIRDDRVHWELKNFFNNEKKRFSQSLVSGLPLRLGQWNHLILGYDIQNARLTMTLNGEMVDFAYATVDGKRSGPQYPAGLPGEKEFGLWVMEGVNQHSPALSGNWSLGSGFTGLIDELELFDDYIPTLPSRFLSSSSIGKRPQSYQSVYASKIFRLNKNSQIHLAEIEGEGIKPSHVQLYLCQSREFFPEHINFSDCPHIYWNKRIIDYPSGEFYQFFLVYKNLEHTLKSITSLVISYADGDPPLPPQWANLNQSREGLVLKWKHTLEEIAGYRIYYRPENFHGPKSMVQLSIEELEIHKAERDVWTYILEGLEKDNLYFLGIRAFDFQDGQLRESEFSPVKSFYYSSDFFN